MIRKLALALVVWAFPAAGSTELALDSDPQRTAAREYEIIQRDAVEAINRWTHEVYPYNEKASNAYMLATLMDPVTAEVRAAFEEAIQGAATPEEKIAKINAWTMTNMSHTQFDPKFADAPGNDPWGTILGSGAPTYRKLLPSEMKAMRGHTGHISGKCMTLAHLIGSVFIQMGVAPDDFVILHIDTGQHTHGVAGFRYEGGLFAINNQVVMPVPFQDGTNPQPMEVIGIYNHQMQEPAHFVMAAGTMDSVLWAEGRTLLEAVITNYDLSPELVEHRFALPCDLTDPDAVTRYVFAHADESEIACLTKYAYQSLYVKHPEYYLAASLRTSAPYELAGELAGPEEVFAWIAENIAPGSIFPDGASRIMTADQVLVFRQGSAKDRALLAATLLAHQGTDAGISLTEEDAFLELGGVFRSIGRGGESTLRPRDVIVRIADFEHISGLMRARRAAFEKAETLARAGKLAEALACYAENTAAYPLAWEVHDDYAVALHRVAAMAGSDLLGKAREHFTRAQELDPTNRRRYNVLAWWALEDGDAAAALAICRAGLAIDPEHGYLKSNLVQSLLWTGDIAGARAVIRANENVTLHGTLFRQIVLDDIAALRDAYAAPPALDELVAELREE